MFEGLPVNQKYSTLVVDPPWQFRSRYGRGSPEDLHSYRYATLSFEELKSFPVPILSSENSHLYLWHPTSFVLEAWELAKRWGFIPKTELIWVKFNGKGNLHMGLGRYYRNAHEPCLFAVKGKLPLLRKNLLTVFASEHSHHSEKPNAFYELVEQASPSPYIDLFARVKRKGWTAWGKEVS